MKIVIERNIPFVAGRLEAAGCDVVYAASEAIDRALVADAEALLVRTRTRCDSALLDGSAVRFIGTATIGTDHIDIDYCERRGITVASAPGCNAPAVAQWTLAAVGQWMMRHEIDLEQMTVGVVGVGHVGSIVARWARQAGFDLLLCDPPRQRGDVATADYHYPAEHFCDLDTIAVRCDIVTFHTPLTKNGPDATHHLAGKDFFERFAAAGTPRLLLNAARGAILDTPCAVGAPSNVDFAIDCWEGEPDIDRALLLRALVATPHVAGYSRQGKQRATEMTLAALANALGLDIEVTMPPQPAMGAQFVTLPQVMRSYRIEEDTRRLKEHPDDFERQRNEYALRDEV